MHTVVVISHPSLLDNEDLGKVFRPRDGFILIKSGQADPRTYGSRGLPAVVIADDSVLRGESPWPQDFNGGLLIMGPAEDASRVSEYIVAGASGFIADDSPLKIVLKAVRVITRGEYWADRTTVSLLLRSLLAVQPASKLSPRELEVLRLLPGGHSNRAIARTLGITYETVRWHLRSIYTKLGAKDRLSVMVQARNILASGVPELAGKGPGRVEPVTSIKEQRVV